MEQQRDYIDELIEESFEEMGLYALNNNDNYNRELIGKLHGTKEKNYSVRTAALSLITAGILLSVMYTSQVQFRVTNLEFKLKTDISIIEHSISIDNYLLGE